MGTRRGDHTKGSGDGVTLSGDCCTWTGDDCIVKGDCNIIYGHNIILSGDRNTVYGSVKEDTGDFNEEIWTEPASGQKRKSDPAEPDKKMMKKAKTSISIPARTIITKGGGTVRFGSIKQRGPSVINMSDDVTMYVNGKRVRVDDSSDEDSSEEEEAPPPPPPPPPSFASYLVSEVLSRVSPVQNNCEDYWEDCSHLLEETLPPTPLIMQQNRRKVKAKRTVKVPDGPDEKEGDETKACKVCFENKANTVLDPCGHATFCLTCVRTIVSQGEQPKCPMCNADIKKVIRIFS